LAVTGLRVSLTTKNHSRFILRDLSLNVQKGKVTALVGQSGSGKTTAALVMLGLVNFYIQGASVQGEVLLEGRDILRMSSGERREILGTDVTFIPQSAYAGLNPFLSIRRQSLEVAARTGILPRNALARFKTLLGLLDLANSEAVLDSYPHQLSGGMRQRVLIAMALLNRPKLLIADEPTTAVDRTRQVRVLDLVRSLCDEEGLGVLLVTHDMGVAARTADYVTVLLSGLVMESGDVDTVLKHPRHPYTMSLLHSLYHVEEPTHEKNQSVLKRTLQGCPFANRCNFAVDTCWTKLPEATLVADNVLVRCHLSGEIPVISHQLSENIVPLPLENSVPIIEIQDLSVSYKSGLSFRDLFRKCERNPAVQYVSFNVLPGQCLGIVGESAAGKTTAMKAATRLIPMENGRVVFEGTDITNMRYGALRPYRARMQVVFQNPDASLSPKMRVADIVLEPAILHSTYPDKVQAKAAADELFAQLDLEPELLDRYPTELSHGQKQRVAISRALITKPKLLFADEPVSAVDSYTRSRILGLFRQKQKEQMALVLISHDLEIVRLMSSVTVVMYKGKVVEFGPSEEIYKRPIHPYTELLMSAVLTTDPEIERGRRTKPSATREMEQTPSMCPFYPYCPIRKDLCRTNQPQLAEVKSGHWVACINEGKRTKP
jgi:peptide/nickel transport system ATP-binding protein